MDQFRIYIFDESHKYLVYEWPEWDYFLEEDVEYVQVRDMEEVKEDLLNRKFRGSEYGIMLSRDKCEVNDFRFGFDTHYTEEDEYSVGTLVLLSMGHRCLLDRMDNLKDICPNAFTRTIKIYSYNNQRLNIEHEKIIYIDVNNEDDIKKDILYGGFLLYTYMVIEEDIKIKDKSMEYKNYKVITEKEIKDRMEDILSDRYDIED